jgi:hypothetical protein
MLPPYELLVEGFTSRDEAARAVDACNEENWLKSALLGVVFLDRPFAIRFEEESEATKLANRICPLGFRCKVWKGPSPSQRVGYQAEQGVAPAPIPLIPLAENPLFDAWLEAIEKYRDEKDFQDRATYE